MKLLDCTCGHYANSHASDGVFVDFCNLCDCTEYDAAGHNPDVHNIVCPRCKLCWMVPHAEGRYYGCLHCSFTLFDKQVEAICERGEKI